MSGRRFKVGEEDYRVAGLKRALLRPPGYVWWGVGRGAIITANVICWLLGSSIVPWKILPHCRRRGGWRSPRGLCPQNKNTGDDPCPGSGPHLLDLLYLYRPQLTDEETETLQGTVTCHRLPLGQWRALLPDSAGLGSSSAQWTSREPGLLLRGVVKPACCRLRQGQVRVPEEEGQRGAVMWPWSQSMARGWGWGDSYQPLNPRQVASGEIFSIKLRCEPWWQQGHRALVCSLAWPRGKSPGQGVQVRLWHGLSVPLAHRAPLCPGWATHGLLGMEAIDVTLLNPHNHPARLPVLLFHCSPRGRET